MDYRDMENAAGKAKGLFGAIAGKKALASGAAVVALGMVFGGGIYTVDESQRAVVTRFGEFNRVADPGPHFKIPLAEQITKYPLGIISDDAAGDELDTLTVDTQRITGAKLRIQYRLPASDVGLRRIYKELGTNFYEVMRTDAVNSFKVAGGKFNSLDIAGKRDELADKTKDRFTAATLAKYGIEIIDLKVTDVTLTKQYMDAVENAAIEKTRVEQARLIQQKEQITAETMKITAVGKANAAIEDARGEAEAVRMNAEAEAKRIDLEGAALARNPSVKELRLIEAWKAGGAQVPQVLNTGGGAGTPAPFLSLFPTGPQFNKAPAPAPAH